MKRSLGVILAGGFAVLGLFLIPARRAPAQDHNGGAFVQRNPQVFYEVKHDVSPPLSSLPILQPRRGEQERERFNGSRPGPIPVTSFGPDLTVQDLLASPLAPVQAVVGLNFDGVISNQGLDPPDTEGTVGATQFVQWVNIEYDVFNKTTGLKELGPIQGNQIWSGFGGHCQSDNDGDPIFNYDKTAERWVAAQFANLFSSSQEYCVAVSTTSDATGTFNRYAFVLGKDLPDYPKLAVWPDGYYISIDDFNEFGTAFLGAKVCAADRSAMLAGNTATIQCFQRTSSDIFLLPSDLDGSTQPPAGEPNFFVEAASTNKINLFKFHVDFVNPSNTTFTGPTAITVASFKQLCPSTTPPFPNRVCVPEPSPGEKVDGLSDRLMYRLAYRNFTDHETLLVSQAVDKGSKIGGVRWYEIRNPNGTPTVFQQATIAEGSNFIWTPSIGADKVGDIAVGFNESSSTVKPAVQFTGRVPTDPLNTMEGIKTLVNGAAVQEGGSNRWGDYSDMSIDPVDDCTFWFTQEYYKKNGFNWATRISNFKFPSCH